MFPTSTGHYQHGPSLESKLTQLFHTRCPLACGWAPELSKFLDEKHAFPHHCCEGSSVHRCVWPSFCWHCSFRIFGPKTSPTKNTGFIWAKIQKTGFQDKGSHHIFLEHMFQRERMVNVMLYWSGSRGTSTTTWYIRPPSSRTSNELSTTSRCSAQKYNHATSHAM